MQERPSIIARVDRALEQTLYYASSLLMLALTGVILYAVIARYFFNSAPAWSEEVPRVIFIWCSYLAVAVALRRGQTLRVMVLIERMRPAPRLAIEMFMHVATLVMLGTLIWFNFPVIELNATTRMLATQWSDALRYWPLTIGCMLMVLYQTRMALASVELYRGAARAGR